MLRQDELVNIKAISTLEFSPAFLRELRKAMTSRPKKSVVPAGSHSTTPGGGTNAPQRSFAQLAGKRQANELARSGDSSESAPVPEPVADVTGENAAVRSRQLGSPKGWLMYAAIVAGPVAPNKPSGSLKPTAKNSDLSEPAVSSQRDSRRMSISKMAGPLNGMKDDTTNPEAQVTNTS